MLNLINGILKKEWLHAGYIFVIIALYISIFNFFSTHINGLTKHMFSISVLQATIFINSRRRRNVWHPSFQSAMRRVRVTFLPPSYQQQEMWLVNKLDFAVHCNPFRVFGDSLSIEFYFRDAWRSPPTKPITDVTYAMTSNLPVLVYCQATDYA